LFQATLSGKVVDEKGKPVAGANVFIEGTYDGASSNETVILVLQPQPRQANFGGEFLDL
jgi:protocatechuate 3,4-dioxygenase beta subunit